MKIAYRNRILDGVLKEKLEYSGAVLIEGPKWCGKTTTAKQLAKSVLSMQNPDNTKKYMETANIKPSLLLVGENPRLLDEWQVAPVLWDAVRYSVDERGETGLYILTGSSVPKDNSTMHTGTGRISRILMRPMSLFESNDSNGTVSLQSLFEKNINIGEISETTIEKIAYFICRGGWPNAVGRSEKISLRQAVDYTEAIINTDASRVDGVQRDPNKVRWLLKSLARNIASESKASTIINDMLIDEGTMSDETLRNYVTALRRIFVVEDLPAWNPSIRSKTTIRTTPKHHFIDPSIGIAALKVSPKDLLNDFNTFGLFFESLCIRDLRIYAQSINGDVFHYRDKSGLEADAIIHLHNGDWAAIEIKLGVNDIDEGAKNLIKLKERINTEKMKEPSFLMILTGTEFAYKRKDGIYVVPIGCLKD